jgi:hypothetical protein
MEIDKPELANQGIPAFPIQNLPAWMTVLSGTSTRIYKASTSRKIRANDSWIWTERIYKDWQSCHHPGAGYLHMSKG